MQAERRHSRRATAHRRRTRAEQVQSRRFVLVVCLLALVIVATAAASYTSRAEASPGAPTTEPSDHTSTTLDPAASLVSATYTAELKASDAGSAAPGALLTLTYDAEAQTLSYKLELTSPLANPSIAAICQGAPTQSSSTVFTIFPGPTVAGNFSGVLAEGNLLSTDLVGPLKGGKLTDLILMVRSGSSYATIGTINRPIDALRGQLK